MADPNIGGTQLTEIILAIGALGTAAFGLVDSLKALPGGGISLFGFAFIRQALKKLVPDVPGLGKSELSPAAIEFALKSQWINGTALTDQTNIAKSLVKLRLTAESAPALAQATGVDAGVLTQAATNINTGEALSPAQTDVYGRFDLMLTTILDQAYQRADQRYRSAAKVAAIPMAVALACVANAYMHYPIGKVESVLIGLIATPLAPIAKDVASAIQTASKTIQTVKKG